MSETGKRHEPLDQIDGQSPLEAAETLGGMAPDDIEAVLAQVPKDELLRIASHLPGTASAQEADAAAATSMVEGTVDELMTPPAAVLESSQTAAEAVAFLVHSESVADISYIYLVDNDKFVGVVGMRDILLGKPGQTLAELMLTEPFAFTLGTGIADAVRVALSRRYSTYPVVDKNNRLMGVLPGALLFKRVAIEISGQAGAQVGVSRDEQITTRVLAAFRMRHPWLQVNLATAFGAAFVVGMFEGTITSIVALAAFLPVLAGQSGNTGCQALAITLRGLTLGQLADYPAWKILRKEMSLGALNGLFTGAVAGLAMWIYAAMSGEAQPMILGLVILIAMVGACTGSGFFGVVVPLALKRFGADPVTASAIFLTTFTDILGMGLMLFLATSILL